MAWQLFDFVNVANQNVVKQWLHEIALDSRMRGRLHAKLTSIQNFDDGFKLPGMVTDTREKHIKELVWGSRTLALRIFLCRGPGDMRTQITLLGGGREKDRKYVARAPHITPEEAEAYRLQVFADPQNRRTPHEFPEDNLG